MTIRRHFVGNLYCIILLTMMVTISACTSSKKSTQEDPQIGNNDLTAQNDSSNHASRQLSPGTALVVLHDFAMQEDSSGDVDFEAVLYKVLAYGPATPQLSPGGKYMIEASEYFKNSEYESGYYSKKDSLVCLIGYRSQAPANGNDSGTWRLMQIQN